MSWIPKTYNVARRPMKAMIKKFPWLKYLPIFRQYAEGGKFEKPDKEPHE